MKDMMQPIVSIRCLTYNHAPYIRQCLDGFVMQKTNFKFEAIVHDDASTDGTADIVREYATKYPDIIKPIYETENQYSKQDGSLSRIMNAAISPSAKYIAMCEGDDYWTDPYKLQKQVDFLEKNPEYGFIGTLCKILSHNNKLKDDQIPSYYYLSKAKIESVLLYDNLFDYAKYGPLCRTVSLCFRRCLLLDYANNEKGDMTIQAILAHDSKFALIDLCSCVYRIHEKGVSHNKHPYCKLKYMQWYNTQLRTLKLLYSNECEIDEQSLLDRENYYILRYKIWKFDYCGAKSVKSLIITDNFKHKRYVRFFKGPFTFMVLCICMRFSSLCNIE